jgi:hypothetical protein
MRRSLSSLLVVTVLSGAVSTSYAAPTAKAPVVEDEATSFKKKGDQAMLELRYEDALDAYAKSLALQPNPALHYNRGRALEALGRYAEALEAYEEFSKNASPDLKAKVPGLADHVKEVRQRVTTLTLNVKTSGARVVLRNVVLGVAPFAAPVRVNAGKATIEITADGYLPYKKELELRGGEPFTLEVTLSGKDTGGTLVVNATPAASVVLDGTASGTTPIEAPVVAGSHTITLSAKGFVTRTTTVVVAEGERKKLDLSLEKESSVFGRWWFWTGVGVVVVGAAALTYGLVTERDAGTGDIDPGRVAAPLIRW